MLIKKVLSQEAAHEDIEAVVQLLSRVYPMSEVLIQEFYANIIAFNLKKNEVLVEEGCVCSYMYFIKRGALMGRATHKGKQIVTYISVENEFVSSISGLFGDNVSKEAIVAVEDVSLLAMHYDTLQRLFLSHFDLNFLFRVMVEQYYKDAQERTYIVRVGNTKERYLYFVKNKPGYLERLPLECVASLLDVKPQTLIKIQKQHTLSFKKDEETELIYQKIDAHIKTNETFRNQDISLSTLAHELGISPNKLSSVLNHYYKLRFVDFINTYRVDYIKNLMASSEAIQHFTIEALAKNAGFASRSAFYNSFKKQVGVSPLQYARDVKTMQPIKKLL